MSAKGSPLRDARLIGPVVRIRVQDDLHPGRLERRQRIGGRRLVPVDPAGEQRRRALRRFGDRQEDYPVELGHPLGVPIIGIAHQFGTLARHQPIELEGARARRLGREGDPVAADRLELRRAGEQHPRRLEGQQRVGEFGGDLDGEVVDLAVGREGRDAVHHLGDLARVVLRRVLLQDLVQIPDHGIGIEWRSIMKFYALAQLEDPFLGIRRVGMPFRSQARRQCRHHVGARQVPVHQRVIELVADEAVTLAALVRDARGLRDVGRGHPDAQRALGACAGVGPGSDASHGKQQDHQPCPCPPHF